MAMSGSSETTKPMNSKCTDMRPKWHELFEYNSGGHLTWMERPRSHFLNKKAAMCFNTKFAGKRAGRTGSNGYVSVGITVLGVFSRPGAHRIIWEMFNGPIPDGMQIDHINGIRDDNRIENLRLATRSQNKMNTGVQSNSSTRLKGVCFSKRLGKYCARIQRNGAYEHLGVFERAEDAHSAYVSRAVVLHGGFMNSGNN